MKIEIDKAKHYEINRLKFNQLHDISILINKKSYFNIYYLFFINILIIKSILFIIYIIKHI